MQAALNQDDIVADAIQAYRHRAGALLPILHAIQDRLGHVPTVPAARCREIDRRRP